MITVEPKTAAQLFVRLTEMEKMVLRHAENNDRLEFLRHAEYAADGPPSLETMIAVRDQVMADFRFKSETVKGFGQTWKF